MKKHNNLFNYIVIVLIIIMIVIISFFVWYITKLEYQISERDNLIQELTISNNLVNEYFNIEYDSVNNTTSYILKDSKKAKVVQIETQIQNHYIKEYTEPTFKKGSETLSLSDMLVEYNRKDSLYNSLLCKYHKLYYENSETKNEMSGYVKILDIIEHNYGISYEIQTSNRDSLKIYTYHLTNTEWVDSALMLLPYYNKKLKKENDSIWTISTPIKWDLNRKKKK